MCVRGASHALAMAAKAVGDQGSGSLISMKTSLLQSLALTIASARCLDAGERSMFLALAYMAFMVMKT